MRIVTELALKYIKNLVDTGRKHNSNPLYRQVKELMGNFRSGQDPAKDRNADSISNKEC